MVSPKLHIQKIAHSLQAQCRHPFAIRPLSGQADNGKPQATSRQQRRAERAIVSQESTFDEITDKHIPQRPLGVVEGTSYSLVILAAIGFGIAILWTAVSSLLIQPKEYTCFNLTLDKLRDDPRVTVRLGTPISGYGQESRNRAARQRIPHRAYKDDNGAEHIQVCRFNIACVLSVQISDWQGFVVAAIGQGLTP